MMTVLTAVALAAVATGVSGCTEKDSSQGQSGNQGTNQAAQPHTVQYTCPMHPDVVTDKPGKCPKCGMDLVEKK